MKKVFCVLVIVLALLCGCSYSANEQTESASDKRFEIELREEHGSLSAFYVIRDTYTGKAYIFVKSGYGGGLTILSEE